MEKTDLQKAIELLENAGYRVNQAEEHTEWKEYKNEYIRTGVIRLKIELPPVKKK